MKPRSRPNGGGRFGEHSPSGFAGRGEISLGDGMNYARLIDVLLKPLDTYDFDQRLQYLEEHAAAQS